MNYNEDISRSQSTPALHPLQTERQALSNPERAEQLSRFSKSPGQYAEGERFLGIPVPVQWRLIQPYRRAPWKRWKLSAAVPGMKNGCAPF